MLSGPSVRCEFAGVGIDDFRSGAAVAVPGTATRPTTMAALARANLFIVRLYRLPGRRGAGISKPLCSHLRPVADDSAGHPGGRSVDHLDDLQPRAGGHVVP